jgi:hypothetical protein
VAATFQLESAGPFTDGGNRDLFARLAKVAERVTLAENEERVLDLRVVHIR